MTARARALAALVATAIALPALAQDKRQRDSQGTAAERSAWHDIAAHEFMLNIVDLPRANRGTTQRRMRKGRVPQHRMRFDRGKGLIYVQHLPDWYFNRRISESYRNREGTERRLSRMERNRGKSFEVTERREIHRHGERGGWVYAAREKESGAVCIVSRLGFLTDWRKLGSATGEHYDTLVSFRDCSGKRSFDDVATWLEGVKIVEPSYNRAAPK